MLVSDISVLLLTTNGADRKLHQFNWFLFQLQFRRQELNCCCLPKFRIYFFTASRKKESTGRILIVFLGLSKLGSSPVGRISTEQLVILSRWWTAVRSIGGGVESTIKTGIDRERVCGNLHLEPSQII